MEEPIQTEYDEIDLMDYVKVILKRKWLILAVFLGAAIVAGIFSFLMPKIYKIDTSLEVGQIAGAVVEEPGQVVEKIKGDVYGIFVREKLRIPEIEYQKIKTENPKDTRLIKMAIESASPPKAKNILEEINNLILAEHQEKIKVKKELIEMNIKTVEGQIEIIKSDIEKVKNKKQSSENDIQRIKNKIESLKEDIKGVRNKKETLNKDIESTRNKRETLKEDIESTRNKIKPVENDIERINIKIANAEEEKENIEAKVTALQQQLVYEQTPGTQFALFDAKEKLANKKQEIENLYLSINSLKRTLEDYNLQISSLERSIEDYNSQINSLERNIEDYNSQINSLERSIEDYNSSINSLEKGLEDYNIQINSLESQIGDHQAQINSLRASLEEIRPTEVVKKPTISEQPVKPKKKLNIVIGGVLGLFLGVFWAFEKEWWEKNRY